VLAGEGNIAGSLAKDSCATVAGGQFNRACSTWSYIGGGWHNTAGGAGATVGGGEDNRALGVTATVGGGDDNVAGGNYSVVAGSNNTASAEGTAIGGGEVNQALGLTATVAGGMFNSAAGAYSTVAGGSADSSKSAYSGVLSGYGNVAGYLSTDSCAVVGGGFRNNASARYSTVGGGWGNNAPGIDAFVGGGTGNTASDTYAIVSAGDDNAASGTASTISGGGGNTASGLGATVGGGIDCSASASNSFAVGGGSVVSSNYSGSAAFNGQTATASGQTRVGILSKASGTFTIDDPVDPEHKILNHYFVESPDMSNLYSGSVTLDASGRADVNLPDYFDALNRNPRVQLTGVGSSDVYVAEDISGNHFAVGGKPGTKVYWQVTGDRKDQSAEITRDLMPVEQPKTGALAGRSLDDDLLISTMDQLQAMGLGTKYQFHTAAAHQRYENMLKQLSEAELHQNAPPVQPRVELKQTEPRLQPLKPQQ
jgi:hypothetical protein